MAALIKIDAERFLVEMPVDHDINGMPAFFIVMDRQTGLRARYSIGATQRGEPKNDHADDG